MCYNIGVLFNDILKYAWVLKYVKQMIDDLCGFMLILHFLL